MMIEQTNTEATMNAINMILVPMMKLTGFRFSKEYRWGTTPFKAFVYRHIDTVAANVRAGL